MIKKNLPTTDFVFEKFCLLIFQGFYLTLFIKDKKQIKSKPQIDDKTETENPITRYVYHTILSKKNDSIIVYGFY